MNIDKVAVVSLNDTVKEIINKINSFSGAIQGFALVLDSDARLHGVINNYDIVRSLTTSDGLAKCAKDVMNRDPICAYIGSTKKEILRSCKEKLLSRTAGRKEITQYVPLIDRNKVVHDVVDLFDILSDQRGILDDVVVYGMGFVGLTVAVVLANRGHSVIGIDNNKYLINQLNEGVAHIFEPRLPDMMINACRDRRLSFQSELNKKHSGIIIVAVGTPTQDDGVVILESLKAVCETIGSRLSRGSLVMLRSTVPVGTTKSLVKDLLEKGSGLKAGVDFYLAFAPERTVEGNAVHELTSLPQIVGGYSERCCQKAVSFWQTITSNVVTVDSLEAAELVKLVNNSYRDLSFAFSNSFALLCDQFNLEAKKIIGAANDGYPRDKIPFPSPGVGGYCLTKDPYLYASVGSSDGHAALSINGRMINMKAAQYPAEIISRYALRTGKELRNMQVFIAGVAFKGLPETNDLRGSCGLSLAKHLQESAQELYVYDAIVSESTIEGLGLKFQSIKDGCQKCDALIIMNNHPNNFPEGTFSLFENRDVLIFDGWSLLDKYEVEQYVNLTYATMGYMTPIVSKDSW